MLAPLSSISQSEIMLTGRADFVDDGCKLDRDMAIFSALVISVDERHTDANIISSKPRRGPRINDISIESEPEDPDALSPLGVYGCNLPSPFQQVMERYERESCRPGR